MPVKPDLARDAAPLALMVLLQGMLGAPLVHLLVEHGARGPHRFVFVHGHDESVPHSHQHERERGPDDAPRPREHSHSPGNPEHLQAVTLSASAPLVLTPVLLASRQPPAGAARRSERLADPTPAMPQGP